MGGARKRRTSSAHGGLFRRLRLALLVLLLVAVAGDAWLTRERTTDWNRPLWVTVYPINGDGSAVSAAYLAGLQRDTFEPVQAFLARQGRRYGLTLRQPVEVRLGPQLHEHPPSTPANANPLAVIWWSLRMRYWAFRVVRAAGGPPYDVRMFASYYDPATHPRLAHSVGLEKGLIGIANLFASASMTGENNVIITHELMHTVGATDKYDPVTDQPRYPQGYADPQRVPRYPQVRAEIMGGRIPLSPTRAQIPASLAQVVIGPVTAREIHWAH
ncbi:MAG: hypothetical protein WCC36_12785 [Gammaproteobacteria bacterium]